MSLFKRGQPSISMPWKLATRYYQTGALSPYVRFINRASRIGFAIGVAALIVGLSVMNGFERELKRTLLSVIPDIEFKAVTGSLPNWQNTAKQIQRHPDVIGVAPYIDLNAMIQKQNDMEAVLLKGVSVDLEQQVNVTPNHIVKGSWLNQPAKSDGMPTAVIGIGLANKLALKVGDRLEILLPTISETGRLAAPTYLNFKIVGLYQVGGQMDYGQVYVPIDTVQLSQNMSNLQAQGIKVALKDPFSARQIAMKIGNSITDYVYVLDWFRSQGHVYNDIVLVKDIMYLVMVLVMAVASFNIISSLSMAVQEKYGDIGILKTLGLTASDIKRTFVYMGLLTAFRGILWGAIIGCALAYYISDIMAWFESLLSVKVLDGNVYFIDYLPSQIAFDQVLIVVSSAMVIAFVASLYPSSKASKLTPVELIN